MKREEIDYIKNEIRNQKITYSQLSQKSAVPLATINNILTGKTPDPRISTLEKIYIALNILPYGKQHYETVVTKEEFCNYLLNDPTILKYLKLKRKSDIRLVGDFLDFLEYRYHEDKKSDE